MDPWVWSITMNKTNNGCDGIPVELFQILKDDAVKVLHSICQQIWKTQQWPQDWKRSVFIPVPKQGNSKECSNYCKIALTWKILQEMGISDHQTCLLRNLNAGKEATVRTIHGTTDWFQIGKGICQGCILSPCLFNLYAEYIMRNAGLDRAKVGIKIAGRNIINLRYADDTTLMAESEEELKSLLMKVKEESEKVGWKLNIQKTKIMASSPIISWQIDGKTMETVTDFIFFDSEITVVGDCSHEIKGCLMFRREAMINIGTVLKRRDISLLKKVHIVKAMVFPVVMYRVGHKEGWVQKNWCFQTVVLEKTLESPWSSKEIKPVNPKGNQPWLFIGSTVEEAEAQILWPSDMKSLLIGKVPGAGKH